MKSVKTASAALPRRAAIEINRKHAGKMSRRNHRKCYAASVRIGEKLCGVAAGVPTVVAWRGSVTTSAGNGVCEAKSGKKVEA